MKTQEIARHLLNRRNAMNPMLLPGEMIASLGSEAMQEALQKRWLVPNPDSGLLQISQEMAMVEEMRGVSDKCPTCNKTECTCGSEAPANTSHGYAFEHALRRPGSGTPLEEAARGTPAPIQELLSPGTGHDSGGAMPPTRPATPAAAPSPTTPPAQTGSAQGRSPNVGDNVLIAQEGKSYRGVVSKLNNGRYGIEFGNEKPPAPKPDYMQNELRFLDNPTAPSGAPVR